MFGSIGMTELIVIMVVALVVIGPKRLPELARSLGKALGDFKRATSDFQNSINLEDDYDLDLLDEDAKERDRKEKDKEEEAAEGDAEPIQPETSETAPQASEDKATPEKTEPAREDDTRT